MSVVMDWIAARGPRERRFVLVGAITVALALVISLVALDRAVGQARAHLAQRERDLAWMRSVAPELAAAGPASGTVSASPGSLIAIVNRSARAAGLGKSLVSSAPSRLGGLEIRLDKAPFDALVGWLERLSEQHRVQVATATIHAAGSPGLVNATLVLKAAP